MTHEVLVPISREFSLHPDASIVWCKRRIERAAPSLFNDVLDLAIAFGGSTTFVSVYEELLTPEWRERIPRAPDISPQPGSAEG